MDAPIISPWLFYIADIVDGVVALALIGIVFASAWLFMCVFNAYYDNKEYKLWKPIVTIIFCIVVALAVPDSDTIYKMAAAKMLTPNNINAVTEYASSLANNATDMIESVMDYGVDRIYDIRNNQEAGGLDE